MVQGSATPLLVGCLLALGISVGTAFAMNATTGNTINSTTISNSTANSASSQRQSSPYGAFIEIVLVVVIVAMIVIFLMLGKPPSSGAYENQEPQVTDQSGEPSGNTNVPKPEY
ncbi:MAG: hypothetical protein KGH57_00380 [Candidatus Micrarchaeota archaeon]|nr:hypothetical protein [Candidatus Micrarchaeota archaeon]